MEIPSAKLKMADAYYVPELKHRAKNNPDLHFSQ